MSNPGVIYLVNLEPNEIKSFSRFAVEDNIGEAIHIHTDNFRFDFTIKEFWDFSNIIEKALNELIEVKGFNISNYDPAFLRLCSGFLPDLISISEENIEIDDLKCIVYEDNQIVLKNIDENPAYQYLINQSSDFLTYEQKHNFREDNKTRLENIYNSIKINGYPYKNQLIILLGSENYVRDGQHRIACLKALGYKNIPVLRFNFKDNSVCKIDFTISKPKDKLDKLKRTFKFLKSHPLFIFSRKKRRRFRELMK